MADNPNIVGMKEDDDTPKSPFPFPFPWFSFLPKFDFRLPLPVNGSKKPPAVVVDEGQKADADPQKPEFVRFPKAELPVASVEAEVDVSGKTSNPVVIWQIELPFLFLKIENLEASLRKFLKKESKEMEAIEKKKGQRQSKPDIFSKSATIYICVLLVSLYVHLLYFAVNELFKT